MFNIFLNKIKGGAKNVVLDNLFLEFIDFGYYGNVFKVCLSFTRIDQNCVIALRYFKDDMLYLQIWS